MPLLWSSAESGEPRCGHTVTRHGDYAYVIGGFAQDSSAAELSIAVMDLKKQAWVKNFDVDVDCNDNRAGHTTVVVGDTLFIYGGEIVDGRSFADSVLFADINPTAMVVEELEPAAPEPVEDEDQENPEGYKNEGPPPARAWHAAVAIENLPDTKAEVPEPEAEEVEVAQPKRPPQMLVFAGQDEGHNILDDLWMMDSKTGWWTNVETAGEAPGRAYHSATYLADDYGTVAVFGGAGANGERFPQNGVSLHMLQTLFPDGEGTEPFQWSEVRCAGPTPLPRCWHGAVIKFSTLTQEEYDEKLAKRQENSAEIEGDEDSASSRAPSRAKSAASEEGEEGDEAGAPDTFVHQTLLVFGGHANSGSLPPVTYSLDLLSNEWSELPIAEGSAEPEPRYAHVAVLGSEQNNVFMFGGMVGSESQAKSGEVACLDLEATVEEVQEATGGAQLGWSKQSYADGSVYEGMMRDDKRHGKGEMLYPKDAQGNFDRYVGDWADDKRSGEGKCTYKCGSVYDGSWAEDCKSGNGTMAYVKGPFTGKSDGVLGEKEVGTVEKQYQGEWLDDERHGVGNCVYGNGDEYDGDWQNGLKDGTGTMKYGNGDEYRGTWTAGKCSGDAGWLRKRNGDVYEGPFKLGKMSGEGTCNYADGSVFQGTFKQGMCNGTGTCEYANRDKYVGKWRANQRNGRGTCYYAAGHVYEGTWADDQRSTEGSNKGTCTYRNGDVYEGSWARDVRHGSGMYTMKNGTTYNGDWRNGMRSGQGECVYFVGRPPTKGDEYSGSWENDVREGKGILTNTQGDVFEGMFESDLQCGQGKLTYANGNIYDGEWADGRQDGRGILENVHGEPARYEGDFREGVAEGMGKAEYTNGDRYEGEFSRGTGGMLVARHGEGVCDYASGDVYEGQWENDKRMGTGIQKYANGESYEGEWKFDARHVTDANWKKDDWAAKESV